MASIRKTNSGHWQATVKHNGHRRSKTFASIEAANQWAKAQEQSTSTAKLEPAPPQNAA